MGCTRRRSGTVNLFGRGRLDSRGWASNVGDLYRNGSAAANFRPHPECLHPGTSVFGGSDVIATEMEKVVDLIVSCDETLSLAGRFELLHLPLSSSRRLVGIFHQIQDFWHRKRQYRANRVARAPFTFVSLHDAFLLQLADADRSACERIRSDRTIPPEPVRGEFSAELSGPISRRGRRQRTYSGRRRTPRGRSLSPSRPSR